MEIRPSIEWNKGHALEYLLETLGLSNSSEVLPLYIGDDLSDEDAFKVIIYVKLFWVNINMYICSAELCVPLKLYIMVHV